MSCTTCQPASPTCRSAQTTGFVSSIVVLRFARTPPPLCHSMKGILFLLFWERRRNRQSAASAASSRRSTKHKSDWQWRRRLASNVMTRIQTKFCFSVREPDTALSPLAIPFECVQISVFCYIFVIVNRSIANTWKCLEGKHLTSNTLKTWRDLVITPAALSRLFDASLVRPPLQAHTKAVQLAKKGQVNNVLPSLQVEQTVNAKTSNSSSKYIVSKEKHCAKWVAKPTHFDLTGARPANRSSSGFGHLHRNLSHTKSMAFLKWLSFAYGNRYFLMWTYFAFDGFCFVLPLPFENKKKKKS